MKLKISTFVLFISLLNVVLYHLPLFTYVSQRAGTENNGLALNIVLGLFIFCVNFILFYLLTFLLRRISQWFFIILFNINAVAFYFMHSHSVALTKVMIGNVINTNINEATGLLSVQLLIYWLILGLIPSILIFKIRLIPVSLKKFFTQTALILCLCLALGYTATTQWVGWLNRGQKTLGGLVLPWAYLVNTPRYFKFKNRHLKKQIPLPNAQITDNKKALFVLVIGESASRESFSLYGYSRKTNPELSKLENLSVYNAESCATYTTAGVKCILEKEKTKELYEPLPSYLYRTGIDVVWRTVNDGEPRLKIAKYQNQPYLAKLCSDYNCAYDEVLFSNLEEEIQASKSDKMLLVLHINLSHGSRYDKKYPKAFEKFTPVCHKNDPSACDKQALRNAYDNTILYTDYFLATLIKKLQKIDDREVAMLFLSDHGESLGENGFYFHSADKSIAPKRQYEIPFMVWTSNNTLKKANTKYTINQKDKKILSQHFVFHSTLDFLNIDSPVFDKDKSIFTQ